MDINLFLEPHGRRNKFIWVETDCSCERVGLPGGDKIRTVFLVGCGELQKELVVETVPNSNL